MKTKRVSLFLISVIMTVTFSFGQTYILEDDIYYTPKAKSVVEQRRKKKRKKLIGRIADKKLLINMSGM
ncbi:MAG: hypothetical protein ACLSG8_08710 [Barnesiella sp.]